MMLGAALAYPQPPDGALDRSVPGDVAEALLDLDASQSRVVYHTTAVATGVVVPDEPHSAQLGPLAGFALLLGGIARRFRPAVKGAWQKHKAARTPTPAPRR